jgi:magnesium transporter
MRLLSVDAAGPGWREITPDQLAAATATASWFWLDMSQPAAGDINAVARVLGLPPDAVADVLTPSEFPKLHDYDSMIFAISHNPGTSDERFTTHEVDCFLTDRFLVTIHEESIPAIEWIAERDMTAYAAPDAVLADILEIAAGRYLTLIDGLGRHIDELESMAIGGNPEILGRVQALRRDTIYLRSVLTPERDMVRNLGRSPVVTEPAVGRRLAAVHDDYVRVVEALDAARALLAAVLDTYRSTVAERTNEVMKVLTVFSAIFLPLSLLAGIYGMNFANMPELEWHWGYFALVGVMTTVAVGLWLYFAWRGFIGGPRIPRVDRAIGKGLGSLVHLTTAPVRGVLDRLTDDR